MPQLPASGIISASMINVALGNPAGDEISWSDMATEYDLSSPNYGDSDPGLGLDELYGRYPAAGDFVFDDAFPSSSDTGWIINNDAQNQSTPQTNEGTINSISYNGTVDSTPTWAKVWTGTTRTADIVVTIPQNDPLSQPYNNYPGTVSGQVSTTQDAYNLVEEDLSGANSMGIDAQTGEVSWTAGNDNDRNSPITSTTFTKSSPNTINPSAGEAGVFKTYYSVLTNNSKTTISAGNNYMVVGVPTTAQGSGQYGNVGGTVSKDFPSTTQYSSSSLEIIGYLGGVAPTIVGAATSSLTFDWDEDGPSNGKRVGVDITAGYNVSSQPMQISGITMNSSYGPTGDAVPGTPQFDDRMVIVSGSTLTDSGSTGIGFQQYSGNGETDISSPPLRIYMNGRNTSTTNAVSRSVRFTTQYGGSFILNVFQLPNISFVCNPTGAIFTFLAAGNTTRTVTITTGLSWTAAITNGSGATFSFSSGFSNTSTSATGNGSVTVYTTSANSGTAKTGTMTITPTGYPSLQESYSLSQAAATVTSNAWANLAGTWVDYSTSTSTITVNQNSSSPYAWSVSYFPIAMKTNYATSYSVSISNTTYITIGSGTGGGSSSLSSINSVASNPTLAQFYVNIGHSPTQQYSNTTYFSTTVTVTFNSGEVHYITVRLRGSGTGGGGTPPGGGSPSGPPSGPPGGPPPEGGME